MTPRIATVAGLVSGATVALLLLVAFAALVPPPAAIAPEGSPSSGTSPSPLASPPSSAGATPSPRSSLIVAGLHIGQPAPPLVLPQLGGGEINLASLAGQPVWINFMATSVAQSRDEFALLNDFAARYADTGLVVIAIDVGEDEDTASAFAVDTSAAFPIGLDLDAAARAAWEVPDLPVHFWIDAEGVVRDAALGSLDAEAMAGHLQAILPGVEVTATDAPASASPGPS